MSGTEPIERVPVATISRSQRQELRLELIKMADGRWKLSTRVWFQAAGGEERPTIDGWTLPISELPELVGAAQAALQEARDRALIE